MDGALKNAVTRYIDLHGGADGLYETAIAGLALMRSSREAMPHHVLYRPALCVVVQGRKQVALGDHVLDYGEMQSLVVSLEMPALGHVTEASPGRPYYGINLDFDIALLAEVLEQVGPVARPGRATRPALFVGAVDGPLAEGMLRLIRLLETPAAIPVLGPAALREIYYWLLTGPDGAAIARLALAEGNTQRIARAMTLLRDNFTRPIRVAELAEAAGMSPSSFHEHFKALTAMTPLQYQKQLRLLEAQRLLVAGDIDAARAAYRVGYESASQFSREYARMFGAPPARHAAGLRGVVA
ncbi:MAG TPA: AraC family transcriptional regulator [Devosia sp.]|nr:AraC family transcriptional regulator [Devosia sp.]